MKIAINRSKNEFRLSNAALVRLCELNECPLFFFNMDPAECYKYIRAEGQDDIRETSITLNIPNPEEMIETIASGGLCDGISGREARIAWANSIMLERHLIHRNPPPDKRADPALIRVITELGPEVNTKLSLGMDMKRFKTDIVVVEIPDGIEWVLEETEDGNEYVTVPAPRWDGWSRPDAFPSAPTSPAVPAASSMEGRGMENGSEEEMRGLGWRRSSD